MKTLSLSLLLALAINSARAGDGTPYFMRVVNGQLYNAERSYKWEKIEARIVLVESNGIVAQIYTNKIVAHVGRPAPGVSYGNFMFQDPKRSLVTTSKVLVPGPYVFIRNYPIEPKPATQTMFKDFAMSTAETKEQGTQVLEVWEYGRQATEADLKAAQQPKAAAPKP
jgi:hypothetical protein